MSRFVLRLFPALAALCLTQSAPAQTNLASLTNLTTSPLALWYKQPAEKWTEALPIGNGRLGAMIFGGVGREHLQLNESTLWAGGPYNPNNTNALAALPVARQLVFDGKYDEASAYISSNMMAIPIREMAYQTLGDLWLNFPTNGPVQDYRRDLDLDTAIATVNFTENGVRYKREIFASAPDQVIVIRLTADQSGKISFTAGLDTPQAATNSIEVNTSIPFPNRTNDATIVMNGVNGDLRGIKGALKFQARLRVLPVNGKISMNGNKITVANADSVTLLIAAATSYKNYRDVSGNPDTITRRQIEGAYSQWYSANTIFGEDTLLNNHIADYQKFFHRVSLTLDTDEPLNIPTDERIKNFANGNDPQFATVYFQFARYLLIACSRYGGQP
ncbi:MAG TPA: glycoside hydrolase family 95 protein, partial [Candidatus Sulfotelmatobacter sp.]|nr:glycoside hydrolase family 95 protein [Candidatus Sulfotelmatobacter sp.]